MKYTMEEYYSGRKRWAIYCNGEMLCVCLYKKGAECLLKHLQCLSVNN